MRELRSATMWSQRVNAGMCKCVNVLVTVKILISEFANKNNGK